MSLQTRVYEFNTGIETSVQPDAGTPTDPNDVLTLSYFTANALTLTTIRAGEVSLADGDVSKAVAFNTPLLTNNYQLFAQIKNTTLGNSNSQAFYEVKDVVKSAAGFTGRISSAIVGNNEVLSYVAIPNSNP